MQGFFSNQTQTWTGFFMSFTCYFSNNNIPAEPLFLGAEVKHAIFRHSWLFVGKWEPWCFNTKPVFISCLSVSTVRPEFRFRRHACMVFFLLGTEILLTKNKHYILYRLKDSNDWRADIPFWRWQDVDKINCYFRNLRRSFRCVALKKKTQSSRIYKDTCQHDLKSIFIMNSNI